jgi:hypothetical protein
LGSARVSRWISEILKENRGMRGTETDRKSKTIKCAARTTVLKKNRFGETPARPLTHRLTFVGKMFNYGLAVLSERVQAFLDSLLVIVHSPRRLCSVKQTLRHSSRTDVEVQDYTAFGNL